MSKFKKKSYLPKQTPEEEAAESATQEADTKKEKEEGEAILPKKQKRPGKQIMDAVGMSLLKGTKPKAPKLANGPSSQNSKKQNRTDKAEKSKDADEQD